MRIKQKPSKNVILIEDTEKKGAASVICGTVEKGIV